MHITRKEHLNSDSPDRQRFGNIGCLEQSIKTLPHALRALLDASYYLRFGLKTPTAKLLEDSKSETERRIVSIVAMLDLDQATLRHITNIEEWQFIDSCHEYLRQHFRS